MGGSADITTITHQQAPESLEETLIAPKLTKIEFPQFLRKVSASSVVVVMNDWLLGAKWGGLWSRCDGGQRSKGCIDTLCQLWIRVKYTDYASQSFVVSKSQCTVCMCVAQFVLPVVVLSTIYQVTNHQPPVLSGHYKGATKEEVALKERKKRKTQKKVKRMSTQVMNRSTHNSPKTRKLELLSFWPIQTLSMEEDGGQSNCRLQISCHRFFTWDRINQISQLCPLPSLCAGCIAGGLPD